MSKIHEALQKAEIEKKLKTDSQGVSSENIKIGETVGTESSSFQASSLPVDTIRQKQAFQNNVICYSDSDILVSEQFRNLNATLQSGFANGNTKVSHCVGISSPGKGEGKSTITINLATTMSIDSDKSVLIIDADLRNPSIHKLVSLDREPGFSNILTGKNTAAECIYPSIIPNLNIIPAGVPVKNPVELLSSGSFKQFLRSVKNQFNIVLIDTPPILPVTETKVLAVHLDGIVLVMEANCTQQSAVEKSIDLLNQMKAPVLGVILNKVKRISSEYYYYYGE